MAWLITRLADDAAQGGSRYLVTSSAGRSKEEQILALDGRGWPRSLEAKGYRAISFRRAKP